MNESIYVLALQRIPKGETRSFGEIAVLAGKPGAARAAGRALISYPAAGKAPWHRAVTSSGKLSIDPERARLQLERLRRDGARPRQNESIAKWVRRVGTDYVANYKAGSFVEADDPRVADYDPLFVERYDPDTTGVDRHFVHVQDQARERSDRRAAPSIAVRAARRTAAPGGSPSKESANR